MNWGTMSRRFSFSSIIAVAVIGSQVCGGQTTAATISYDLNIEFSGGTAPSGFAPWLSATFDDGGGIGSVTLTLDVVNLASTEFVREWYFNLDPALDPTALAFSAPTKTGSFANPTISLGVDQFKADGDGRYDILVAFATGGGPSQRFNAGDQAVFTITGISTLTAASFKFLSAPDGGHGPFHTAAHVQGTGGGEDSGWVTTVVPGGSDDPIVIPEPSTWLLALLAICAGLGHVARRRRRRAG